METAPGPWIGAAADAHNVMPPHLHQLGNLEQGCSITFHIYQAFYAIVNKTNGHRYVGQASDMNKRTRSHVRELEAGIHRTSKDEPLQRAWLEFGPGAFDIVVLEIVTDNRKATSYHVRPDNLSLAEHHYINERSEYNVDKRIVRDDFRSLLEEKAWRDSTP